MAAKSLALALTASLLLPVTAQSAQPPDENPRHKAMHRKHVGKSSPPYGVVAQSVLAVPSVATPAPSVVNPPPPAPAPPPAPEPRPALITPGAPAYAPGILVPGPLGGVPQCAPLSRSQGLC